MGIFLGKRGDSIYRLLKFSTKCLQLFVFYSRVDQLSRFSCLLILFVVVGPVVASILYYFTTDWDGVPEHCKSIIQRLTRGLTNRSKSADD